jgi:MFS family permease
MSLSDIYFMEAIVLILTFLVEIPTGAIADMIGRKRMIIIGVFLDLIGMSIFAFGEGVTAMWSGNIFVMIGMTCVSGADIALLRDSLAYEGREREFHKILGQGNGGMIALGTFGALATGFLAAISLRLPVIAGLPFLLVSIGAAFAFVEPPIQKKASVISELRSIALGARVALRKKEVLWIILFSGLAAVVGKISFFSYNPYFEEVSLDLSLYGVVLFCSGILSWLGSTFSHVMHGRTREYVSVIVSVILLSMPFMLMGLFPTQESIGFIAGFALMRGFIPPLTGEMLNREIDGSSRATVNSVKSSVAFFMQMVALGIYGFAIDAFSLTTCFVGAGTVVFFIGVYLIYTYRPKAL